MSTASQPAFDRVPNVSRAGVQFSQEMPPGGEGPEHLERAATNELHLICLLAIRLWNLLQSNANCQAVFESRWRMTAASIHAAFRRLHQLPRRALKPSIEGQLLLDHASSLRTAARESSEVIETVRKMPSVALGNGQGEPRSYALVDCYLRSVGYFFDLKSFSKFVVAAQNLTVLEISEIWSLKAFLQFALLEQVGSIAADCTARNRWVAQSGAPAGKSIARRLSLLLGSLQRMADLEWKTAFEQVNRCDEILALDPAGAYSQMDFESRQMYRTAISELAKSSKCSEPAIASGALELARAAANSVGADERVAERRAHVGYYLLDEGRTELEFAIAYRPSLLSRIRKFLLGKPEFLYLSGIALSTFSGMALLRELLDFRLLSFVAGLLLLLSLDRAVATVNLLVTIFVPPRRMPKLDFSKGIPADKTTVVAIPALLISEGQTKKTVRDLEIRYLANKDRNLHFALLTDPPDSLTPVDEKDSLAKLCARLIHDLNQKYAADGKGHFFLFHRSRIYNAVERIWMGWERKRGKLLEFNNLLLGRGDNFLLKVGDISLLRDVKYVITLDADTQLPRGAARRLIGAMAHPLNRAVIDPMTNTVINGHGILQPRINISIESASRSRLAALFSGDTGFDIYTRAVSDVYQDLFGEGTFVGKGIYEVSVFQQVLEKSFPCNAVLSHDLIEGAYARAGLVSDVEVIDDYPSHLRAFSRRKHRWIRGDWQILFWLFPRVRNAVHKTVSNPLNLISRWKIVDNLRRSLTECATFLLLLFGWLDPSVNAFFWTVAALAIMAFPAYSRLLISIVRVGEARYTANFWKGAASDFVAANVALFFRIAFLCYESMVSLDAVIRTLVRLTLTRTKLLEWETAAETELTFSKKSAGDTYGDNYLDLTPILSLALWLVIAAYRPASLLSAAPLVVLWVASKPIGRWLSRPSRPRGAIPARDRDMLRDAALRTWRFFRAHSNEHENWLIPDVVQADPPKIGHRVSTTDLGLLFNVRLAAYDLGFLTMPEVVRDTERTLESVSKMVKYKGHLYNWYNTQTLEPMRPLFVSTVDNGNLLCSLWTLKQGCLEMAKSPLFRRHLWEGIQDHVVLIIEMIVEEKDNQQVMAALEHMQQQLSVLLSGSEPLEFDILPILSSDLEAVQRSLSEYGVSDDIRWWVDELSKRVANVCQMVKDFAPWMLPEFVKVREIAEIDSLIRLSEITLESAPNRLREMDAIMAAVLQNGHAAADVKSDVCSLRTAIARSLWFYRQTADRLVSVAARANALANEMDFGILYNPVKKLLSIGYDGEAQKLSAYHYDLLASEARAATFGAIAKGDIPEDSWLHLERPHAIYKGERVLMSWSGTMFEYLMPSVWMRCYRKTMLHKAARTAIRLQQKFVRHKSIPWGISESACGELSGDGEYIYHAFGVPGLALNRDDHSGDIVISPYSSFLACLVDGTSAVRNLRKMRSLGWLGSYGFYDAVDHTPSRVRPQRFKVVPTWMAHHQGMSLISAASVLCDSRMQSRFHAEPVVAASERLLHEKSSCIRIIKAGGSSRKKARRLSSRTGKSHPLPTATPDSFGDANVPNPEMTARTLLAISWRAWARKRIYSEGAPLIEPGERPMSRGSHDEAQPL